MAASSSKHVFVDIAFAEPAENSWVLNSAHFPSKIGGKPSWLSMKDLPRDIKCDTCNKTMTFLLQVYSPREAECTFHRSLFLFICNNGSCVNHRAQVFRCQLPRQNDYYSPDPPCEDASKPTLITPGQFGLKVCAFCGASGNLSCAKCSKASYCSKDHQIVDWKQLGHKESCGSENKDCEAHDEKAKALLLPELELTLDLEENYQKESSKPQNTSGDKEYLEALKSIKPSLQNEDLETVAAESEEDKCFMKFRKVCSDCPEHVLRYVRNDTSTPLWATDVNQLDTASVPRCENCNSERSFEFQVMPQLISQLGPSFKADFATLVIYTCKDSCPGGPEYKREFVYKQVY